MGGCKRQNTRATPPRPVGYHNAEGIEQEHEDVVCRCATEDA